MAIIMPCDHMKLSGKYRKPAFMMHTPPKVNWETALLRDAYLETVFSHRKPVADVRLLFFRTGQTDLLQQF
jgi:hypothetical protein